MKMSEKPEVKKENKKETKCLDCGGKGVQDETVVCSGCNGKGVK